MTSTSRPVVIEAAGAETPLAPAVEALKKGGVVAYPTETFYGLGADPFNPAAIERLFALKGRSAGNPISLIIADRSMLDSVAADVGPAASVLMDRFWPGPLTLVLKASAKVPPSLIAGTGKVGVRLSSHPMARALSAAFKSPITATSANPSGLRPPATARQALDYFNGSIDVLIDAGELKGRLGSTVVDVSGVEAVVLREGEVPSSDVFKALA